MYSYPEIVKDLLAEFPEISKDYADEIAWVRAKICCRLIHA